MTDLSFSLYIVQLLKHCPPFFFSRKEGTQITIQEAKESLETPVVAQHPSLLWPL
ncbi:MAG TPA: hypothetical protein PLB53_03235 [Candidatus Atribacteria bacterium]|jgi:hypothetical protein|nr:hypothetical protein [Candidatus Atribacteria bacterium]